MGESISIDIFPSTSSNTPNNNKRKNIRSTLLICVVLFSVVCVLALTFSQITFPKHPLEPDNGGGGGSGNMERLYRYQSNYLKYHPDSDCYSFVIISDKDENSLDPNSNGTSWQAILKYGTLKRSGKGTDTYTVEWRRKEDDVILKSSLNSGKRGMECSELVYFDGKLLTCDDRTGIVYEIQTETKKVFQLNILAVGDGKADKPFKCEWMTVVDDLLYVGSFGKEFVSGGKIVDTGAQWVKRIDRGGQVTHLNWTDRYELLRERVPGTKFPGYILHEAIMWYPDKNQWVMIPRRLSDEPYEEKTDALKGTNYIFIASQDFSDISVNEIKSPKDLKKGTSSFKFIPYQNGDIIQLKTIETTDQIASYISVVNIYTNEVLMDDKYIDDVKFEGVEFI